MKEIKFLIIHCTDTRPSFPVTKDIITQWHQGPLDIKDKKGNIIGVKFRGKTYTSRDKLPNILIGDKSVRGLHGRGWTRDGYSDMIQRYGIITNITPYDKDKFVDYNEITWGVAGINNISRHVVLEGGRTEDNKSQRRPFLEIFTAAQFTTLVGYCKQFLKDYPGTYLSGHYVFDPHKTCPNFDIIETLHRDAGIPAKHIYTG